MTPESEIAAREIAKSVLTELRSKDNHHTLRQLLDKYSPQAKPLCPSGHEVWLWLNVIVHRVAEGK